MGFWLRRGAIGLAIVLAASQFVRPTMTNPPIEPGRTIQAYLPHANAVAAILDRSCRDCHANSTVWPWYSHVAPVSWLVAHDVTDGREAVNFSEWGAYESVKQEKLLKEACDEVKEGAMPPRIYTWMHPDAKLTGQDVEAICQVAAQP